VIPDTLVSCALGRTAVHAEAAEGKEEDAENGTIPLRSLGFSLRPLVRQAKPDLSCELKGVHHVKCL